MDCGQRLVSAPETFDIVPFKQKSVSVHWEFMYTRSLFGIEDIAQQGQILKRVAVLVHDGTIQSTLTEAVGIINADNLIKAHTILESGKARGKRVLEGF